MLLSLIQTRLKGNFDIPVNALSIVDVMTACNIAMRLEEWLRRGSMPT
jgi:hypothetical protein